MTRGSWRTACGVFAAAMLCLQGCMTSRQPAPVSDRNRPPPPATVAKPAPVPVPAPAPAPPPVAIPGSADDPRPEFYTVKKGDTLFTIALDHGLDYTDLRDWNNLENPNVILIGQQLRLRPSTSVKTALLKTAPKVEGKPVGTAPPATAANEAVKSQPKAVKLPYSDQALAQLAGQPQVKPVAPPPVAPPPVAA
ncbi:MAG: metalloendopeptidase-like rane protein, partial [Betaproteobacteria bacterium]|nr:metalloendopeptidase-like rane protein [Betaproteobacteria bacterium]